MYEMTSFSYLKNLACDLYSNLSVVTTRILDGETASIDEFPWMVCKI